MYRAVKVKSNGQTNCFECMESYGRESHGVASVPHAHAVFRVRRYEIVLLNVPEIRRRGTRLVEMVGPALFDLLHGSYSSTFRGSVQHRKLFSSVPYDGASNNVTSAEFYTSY